MIKRLRLKFICVGMALVTVLLAVILALICRFTWKEIETRVTNTLQAACKEAILPGEHNGPGPRDDGMVRPESQPCFVLEMDPRGELRVSESSYYDLSDPALLREIFDAAQQSGQSSGILFRHALWFYHDSNAPFVKYAFMDISSEISTMRSLMLTCVCIGAAAFVLFCALMWALSKWMVAPVEEAWERQRQFVADASHELKTPLTVILTNAELLQSEEYDQQAKGRFVQSIHTMSVQMRGLVEVLLDMARVDHGTLRGQMTPLDLSELAEAAALPFEAVYFEAGRTLECDIAPGLRVLGSSAHLRQVVEILLDNGRKYSKEATAVSLRLSRHSHGRVLLRVDSRGEHLTSQQCKDIFKRFYRVDAARKMNHSYGLGLSIARRIIEEHKGKIWCESKDGVNTFYVSLPVHH